MKKILILMATLILLTTVSMAAENPLLCPVTGEKVDPKTAINYEYKGNNYTFCCAGCVDQFKKDPGKYIAAMPPLSGTIKEGVREIMVIAKKFEFSPDPIGVRQGEKVRLRITATDTEHGFGVQEYKIDQKLPVGKEQIVEFTADQAGTFIVKCTVFCGSRHGDMKGRLIVQPLPDKMNMPGHSGMNHKH